MVQDHGYLTETGMDDYPDVGPFAALAWDDACSQDEGPEERVDDALEAEEGEEDGEEMMDDTLEAEKGKLERT